MKDKGFSQVGEPGDINNPEVSSIAHVFKNSNDLQWYAKLFSGSIEPLVGGGVGLNTSVRRVYAGEVSGAVSANLSLLAGVTDPLQFAVNRLTNHYAVAYISGSGVAYLTNKTNDTPVETQVVQVFFAAGGGITAGGQSLISDVVVPVAQIDNFATATVTIDDSSTATASTITFDLTPQVTGEANQDIECVMVLDISARIALYEDAPPA